MKINRIEAINGRLPVNHRMSVAIAYLMPNDHT